MIEKIHFKNYKAFKSQQMLELRKITILIGKNSSGKSAILKLPTILEGSLSGNFNQAISIENGGIEVGSEFRDLVYARRVSGILEIGLESEGKYLEVQIGAGTTLSAAPEIFSWKLDNIEIDNQDEKFKGFIPEGKSLHNFKLKTEYLSSVRSGLERTFEAPTRSHNSVGLTGENVYGLLVQDAISSPQALLKNVSQFYKDNFEGWSVFVNQDRAPFYQIELHNDELKINLKEVGLGMVHALPIVVQAHLPVQENTLILIEEPELHLHPAAHGNLAELLVSSAIDNSRRYLVETHSQNFVLRLRRLVVEEKLDKKDLLIYYVDFNDKSNESTLTRIEIDENGKPRDLNGNIYWPDNIFSETLEETTAIRTAQLNKLDGSKY